MPHLPNQVCDLILYDLFLGIGFLRLYLYVQSLSSSSMLLKITFGYGSSSFPLIIVRHAFEVIIKWNVNKHLLVLVKCKKDKKKNLSEKVKKTLNSTYKTENIDINCKKRQILSEKSKKKNCG